MSADPIPTVNEFLPMIADVELAVRIARAAGCSAETIARESGLARELRLEHNGHDGGQPRAVLLELAGVAPRAVEWAWSARIPLGKITVIDGDPDVGKSTLTLDLSARITTGAQMPDGSPGIHGSVVLLSAEDDAADTIVPRLIAAGADLERVRMLLGVPDERDEVRPFVIPDDLPSLERAVEETHARLVVIDPLMALLGDQVASNRDQGVRRALAPVAALAERTRAAVIVVRHLNKGTGGPALYRGGGSIGIIGAARSGLVAARDPDDDARRVLAVVKSNLAARAPSLAYTLEPVGDTVRVQWLGESQHTASTLLAAPVDEDERSALEVAIEYLRDELADGPRGSTEVEKGGRANGISERTLARARTRLGVRARKTGGRGAGWELSLPAEDPPPPEDWS